MATSSLFTSTHSGLGFRESLQGFVRRWGPYIAVLLTAILEFRDFFGPGSVMIGDFVPPSTWYVDTGEVGALNPSILGGTYNVNVGYSPLDFGFSSLAALIGPEVAYRLIIIGIAVLAGSSIIIFLRSLHPKFDLGPIVVGIVGTYYVANPWFVADAILSGHVKSLGLAYALCPLLLALLVRMVERPRPSALLVLTSALTFGILFVTDLGMVVFLFPLVILVPTVLFRGLTPADFLSYIEGVKRVLLGFALGILVAIYAVLPFAALALEGSNLQYTPISLGLLSATSRFADPITTLRLLSYWSTPYSYGIYNPGNPWLYAVYQVASYAPLLLILASLVSRRVGRWPSSGYYVFTAIGVLVYVALSGGTQILGTAYYSLAVALPFMDEPTQFLVAALPIFALAIGVSLDWLIRGGKPGPAPRPFASEMSCRKERWPRRMSTFLVGQTSMSTISRVGAPVLVGCLLVSVWPAWTGTFSGAYTLLQEPPAYSAAFEFLATNSEGYRSLWLPSTGSYVPMSWAVRFGYDQVSDPVRWQSSSPILNPPFGSLESQQANKFIFEVEDALYHGTITNVGSLLTVAAVKYLVIRTDVLPSSFGSVLLNAAENQSDLSLVWEEGPLHMFENRESVAYGEFSSTPTIVYGGFRTLNALPWLGADQPQSVPLAAEEISPSAWAILGSARGTVNVVPTSSHLEWLTSQLPATDRLSLEGMATSPWVFDTYAGSQTADVLYGGGLETDGPTLLSTAIHFAQGGKTALFIDFLNGWSNYNVSIDGVRDLPQSFDQTTQGYSWAEYIDNETLGGHTLDIQPLLRGQNGVGGIMVANVSDLTAAAGSLTNSLVSGRVLYAVSTAGLAPNGSVTWKLQPSRAQGEPYEWALLFGPGGGVAGGGEPLQLESGVTVVRALVSVSSAAGPPTGEVILRENRSGVEVPFVLPLSPPTSGMAWITTTANLTAGAYGFQFSGSNVTFYAASISGPNVNFEPQIGPTFPSIDGGGANLTIDNASGLITGHLASGRFGVVSVGMAYTPQWSASIEGNVAPTIVVGGFALGTVFSTNGGAFNFSFDYGPSAARSWGIAGSGFVLAAMGSSMLALWVLSHRRRSGMSSVGKGRSSSILDTPEDSRPEETRS